MYDDHGCFGAPSWRGFIPVLFPVYLPGPISLSMPSAFHDVTILLPVTMDDTVLNFNVGVLGHIDSGKTSLARALSSVASTASFDKNPQSQERGITIDLGFSSFSVPAPARLQEQAPQLKTVQFTLVDCPGHASLIRTIIGGEGRADSEIRDDVCGYGVGAVQRCVFVQMSSCGGQKNVNLNVELENFRGCGFVVDLIRLRGS